MEDSFGKVDQSRLTFDLEDEEAEEKGFLIGETPQVMAEPEEITAKRKKFDTNLSTTVETLSSNQTMDGVKRKRATRRKDFCDEPVFVPRIPEPLKEEEPQGEVEDDFGIERLLGAERQKNIELIRQRLWTEEDVDDSMDTSGPTVVEGTGTLFLSTSVNFLPSVKRPERISKLEVIPEQTLPTTAALDLNAVPDRRLESVLDEPLVSSSLGVGLTLQFLQSRGRPLALCDGSRALIQREIQLVHYDEQGNVISEKEAYKLLSHKFHGNKSGKNKEEKRLKRMADRSKAQKATITGQAEPKESKKPTKKPGSGPKKQAKPSSAPSSAPLKPKIFGMK